MRGRHHPATWAQRIAGQSAQAWYRYFHHGDADAAAVGVIAALTLINPDNPGGPAPGPYLARATDSEIVAVLRRIWADFWLARPELGRLTRPLCGWLDDDQPSPELVKAAAATARAAVAEGLLVMARAGLLTEVDMIGVMYMHMRSAPARSARGEFYTAPEACETLVRIVFGDEPPQPGQSLADEVAGTGGMIRARAAVLRQLGLNPADYRWYANDASLVAAAGLAVNAHVWGLGPNVYIGTTDILACPDWAPGAAATQRDCREHREHLVTVAALAGACGQVLALERQAAGRMAAS